MTTMFSVIIPVFNKGPYIARAINSILSQSYSNFELLIVCDPSTDNSNEEVARFDDSRIRVFKRDQPGPGGYAARNLGIQQAKGEWIAFLDADDEWYQDHLENMVRLITRYPNVNVHTCARATKSSGLLTIDEFSKNRKETDFVMSNLEYLHYCSIGKRAINTNSICFKRELIDDVPVFPAGRAARSGDLYAWVILVAKSRKLAWSNHVGSIAYRDVVGVSLGSTPSLKLSHEMVEELTGQLPQDEFKLLKRYANRLIKTAWLENKRFGNPVTMLAKHFYWRHDIWYCLKWTLISWTPWSFLVLLRRLRRERYIMRLKARCSN